MWLSLSRSKLFCFAQNQWNIKLDAFTADLNSFGCAWHVSSATPEIAIEFETAAAGVSKASTATETRSARRAAETLATKACASATKAVATAVPSTISFCAFGQPWWLLRHSFDHFFGMSVLVMVVEMIVRYFLFDFDWYRLLLNNFFDHFFLFYHDRFVVMMDVFHLSMRVFVMWLFNWNVNYDFLFVVSVRSINSQRSEKNSSSKKRR